MGTLGTLSAAAATVLVAALTSATLIVALYPLLQRYSMARPNARSSHASPTPQGGGIAVIAATLIGAWLGTLMSRTGVAGSTGEWLAISTAALLLALTGAIDDIRGLGPGPRLLIQTCCRRRDLSAAGRFQCRARCCPGGSSARCCCWAASGSSTSSISWTVSTG